ncbi:MAG: tail fiber assembly protein [Plesiomonas shigelloides]
MKYFKDSNNSVFAFESDGSQDDFIGESLIPISEEEAISIANPPPSHDELVAKANSSKLLLQEEAELAIKPLERAKSFGIATPQEISLLTEWEKYSVYLMRVDTSKPDQIVWPTKPQ